MLSLYGISPCCLLTPSSNLSVSMGSRCPFVPIFLFFSYGNNNTNRTAVFSLIDLGRPRLCQSCLAEMRPHYVRYRRT